MRSVTLLSALLLAACSSSPTPSTPKSGSGEPTQSIVSDDTLTAALGRQTATRDRGLRLTFLKLEADSRCPANVVCVWEGDAAVKLRAEAGNSVVEATLHTALDPKQVRVGNFTLSILEVRPYPGTTETPSAPTLVVRAVRE